MHAAMLIVFAKSPLGENEYVYNALQWAGIPFRVHSCLMPSIPIIDSWYNGVARILFHLYDLYEYK